MKSEKEVTTKLRFTSKDQLSKAYNKLTPIQCGTITRLFRRASDFKGKVYIVGGLVTDGVTLRDIDIVVSNVKDIPKIKKLLGKYARFAHFLWQKEPPPGGEYIRVTGKIPKKSVDLYKKHKGRGRYPTNEYAYPV